MLLARVDFSFVGRVVGLLASAVLLVLPLVPAKTADDPAIIGQWSPVTNVGIVAIHAHLLPDGRALFFDSVGSRAKTWNPTTGASLPVPDWCPPNVGTR